MNANNGGFSFLKTVSDSSNPFNLIVENKLSNKLLAAQLSLHQTLPYSPSL